jgi:hypothetical protein
MNGAVAVALVGLAVAWTAPMNGARKCHCRSRW